MPTHLDVCRHIVRPLVIVPVVRPLRHHPSGKEARARGCLSSEATHIVIGYRYDAFGLKTIPRGLLRGHVPLEMMPV